MRGAEAVLMAEGCRGGCVGGLQPQEKERECFLWARQAPTHEKATVGQVLSKTATWRGPEPQVLLDSHGSEQYP